MGIRFLCLMFILVFCKGSANTTERDTLIVGYTAAPPFILEQGADLSGINILLWDRVAKDLDLPYKLVRMQFPKMLDSLEAGAIDLSINPLTITSERSKKMEFTHSFYASNATIAIAEKSSLEKLVQFLKGFFNLNFLRGLLLLLTIILLFGFVGWLFERKANPEHFRSGWKGIWDGLWWSAVTLTTVGYGDKSPRTGFGKIAALVLMFTGLLFISGLTAGIASSLTVNQLNSNPDSFNEFKERKVGSVKKTGSMAFLRAQFFKDITGFQSVGEGLLALKKNRIEAFVYDEPILSHRIQTDSSLSALAILPIKFDVQFYAFGLAKDKVALEQQISQRILEIMETAEWRIVLNEYGLTEI